MDEKTSVLKGSQTTVSLRIYFDDQIAEVHTVTESRDEKLDIWPKMFLGICKNFGFTIHSNRFASDITAGHFKLNFEVSSRSHLIPNVRVNRPAEASAASPA